MDRPCAGTGFVSDLYVVILALVARHPDPGRVSHLRVDLIHMRDDQIDDAILLFKLQFDTSFESAHGVALRDCGHTGATPGLGRRVKFAAVFLQQLLERKE